MSDLAAAEEQFKLKGSVSFTVPVKESIALKKAIKFLVGLEVSKRKKGWRAYILAKFYMFRGMIATLRLSFYSQNVAQIFDFFAMNSTMIREVEAKEIQDNNVSFTFYAKTHSKPTDRIDQPARRLG